MDLTEFLEARWDEDGLRALAAQASHPGPWHVHEDDEINASNGLSVLQTSGGFLSPGAVVSRHIASWDPAHVLAEIAAKRAILALHSEDDDPCVDQSASALYADDWVRVPWPVPDRPPARPTPPIAPRLRRELEQVDGPDRVPRGTLGRRGVRR